MAWYAVYETATGALVSVGESVAPTPTLTALGLTAVLAPTYVHNAKQTWNTTTKVFENVAATVTLRRESFFRLFTEGERTALRGNADEKVKDFLWLLGMAESIELSHARIVQALTYLVNIGILTAPRATAIGNNQPPP